MATIIIKESKLDQNHADFNQTLAGLSFMADLRNAQKKTVGEYIHYFITDSKISLTLAKQLNALGVELRDYPIFIDTSVPCPFTYVDEEGVEQSHTWETWKNGNHTFIDTTGATYVQSSGNDNKWKTVAELSDVIDDCIDLATLKGIIPVPEE